MTHKEYYFSKRVIRNTRRIGNITLANSVEELRYIYLYERLKDDEITSLRCNVFIEAFRTDIQYVIRFTFAYYDLVLKQTVYEYILPTHGYNIYALLDIFDTHLRGKINGKILYLKYRKELKRFENINLTHDKYGRKLPVRIL